MLHHLKHPLLATLLALTLSGAQAFDFNGSGFLTLAAGKMIRGETRDAFFVSDYGQGAIYDRGHGWSFGPDSKLGLQGVAVFDHDWSMTGQIVARGADNGQVDLEWLYASYRASENITLQAGRKRLPLFYYSESQDVGLTLPWLRLPPAAYGWDVVNFNGASVLWRTPLGKWNSAAEVFYGAETRRGNPYLDIYNGRGADWDEKWNNIRGLSWTVSRDWLELRASYVASGLKYWNPRDVAATFSKTRQSFLSLAAAIDLDHWLIRAEVSKIDRPGFAEHDRAALLGAGYRLGKWLPMITFARFHGRYLDGTPNERFDNLSLSLRYDLTPSSALKLQFDSFKDRSDVGITCYQDPVNCLSGSQRYGDSRLLGVSYDLVF